MNRTGGVLARIPAGIKFAALFGAGIGLYLINAWPPLAATLGIALVAALSARIPATRLARSLGGLVIIIGIVVIMTGLTADWDTGVVSGLRLMTLCVLAYAITSSTRFSETLALFDRLLAPTARIGLQPARISLALALTVRFIPELRATYARIREAQQARGLQHHPVATLVPMIIRTLQTAEQVSEAIDARAYDTRGGL